MSSSLALGIDVGGTKTRVALVDPDGNVLALSETPTSAEGGADPGFTRSLILARDVAQRAREQGWAIDGVGVGIPEYVDPTGMLRSRDVMAWDQQPAEVFTEWGPLVVESDVRCGAFAESMLGAGRGATSMLYVSIGTGISCALVIEGRLWRGYRGEAIALGELPVDRMLEASDTTTLEQYASGAAIARRYTRMTGEAVDGAREVLARARAHDIRAERVVDSTATAVGAALAWAVHLLDPQMVVLGGGLGASGGPWCELVGRTYLERSRPEPPPIITALLGANSGVVGAGLVALSAHEA